MDFKRNKLAAAMAGLLTLGGLGVGVAAASNGSAKPPVAQVQQSSPTQTTAPAGTPAKDATKAPGEMTPEPSGPDADTLQQGDQTTPDTPGEASDVSEKEGTEQAGDKEADDANLPGGGHADPEGQNVDHQFDGVE